MLMFGKTCKTSQKENFISGKDNDPRTRPREGRLRNVCGWHIPWSFYLYDGDTDNVWWKDDIQAGFMIIHKKREINVQIQ